jgi:hypothetical protein
LPSRNAFTTVVAGHCSLSSRSTTSFTHNLLCRILRRFSTNALITFSGSFDFFVSSMNVCHDCSVMLLFSSQNCL